MVVQALRDTIHLENFVQFAKDQDEDLNAHVQRFEITYVANEIWDDEQKLHTFPATFKHEAASWYGNLEKDSKATY